MKRWMILLTCLLCVSCARVGRETSIKALQQGVRANDAQVANLADIAHSLNRANGLNRLRAGDPPAVVIGDVIATDKDIETERVNHADTNRVFDYADIYLQSQRWGGEVLWRMARTAADNTTVTPPATPTTLPAGPQ